MGLFSNIDKAEASVGRVYFKAGTYDIEIQKAEQGETRLHVGLFGLTMQVIGSNNADFKVGSTVNYVTMSDQDSFLGNVKAVAMAVLGNALPPGATINPKDITESVIEGMFKVDKATNRDMWMGQKLHVVVVDKPKKDGGIFSAHNWFSAKAA